MANQPPSLVLLDRQMIVDGVMMQEKIDLTKTVNETGVEERLLSHMKVMTQIETDEYGDFSYTRVYTAKQSITDDRSGYRIDYTAEQSCTFDNGELVEQEVLDWELENFKNEWEEKWNPSIGENLPNLE